MCPSGSFSYRNAARRHRTIHSGMPLFGNARLSQNGCVSEGGGADDDRDHKYDANKDGGRVYKRRTKHYGGFESIVCDLHPE